MRGPLRLAGREQEGEAGDIGQGVMRGLAGRAKGLMTARRRRLG